MARPLLPDGLWAEIAPLLPPERAEPKGGFILEEICSGSLSYSLGYKYKMAKTIELICEVVENINRNRSIGNIVRHSNAAFHRDERLITAAQIYRRSIDSMPSVEAAARMVGLNRNTITDGFKDMFSMSPGEYSRFIRLEWAKEKMSGGDFCVAEVAKMCGSTTTSAFSRADKEHFGKLPSET